MNIERERERGVGKYRWIEKEKERKNGRLKDDPWRSSGVTQIFSPCGVVRKEGDK